MLRCSYCVKQGNVVSIQLLRAHEDCGGLMFVETEMQCVSLSEEELEEEVFHSG